MNCQAIFSLKFSILSAILFVVICQAVSSYKLPRHHNVRRSINQEVENDIKTRTGLMLKLINLRAEDAQHTEVEQPPLVFAKYLSEADAESTEPSFNTSCGKVNCDSVPDYPKEEVQKIYEEKYKKKEIRDTQESVYNPVSVARFKPSVYSTREMTRSVIHKDDSYRLGILTMPDCETRDEPTYPKEAIDSFGNSQILLSLRPQENFGPIGRECTASKECSDSKTPSNKIYSCRTKTKWVTVPVLVGEIEKKDDLKSVKITDGCECKLVNKYRQI